jgi:hypothetical protein
VLVACDLNASIRAAAAVTSGSVLTI